MIRALARLEQTVDLLNLTGTCCMNVNITGADGTTGLVHGERIKDARRTRASTVMTTLLGKHTRGQNMKSVMWTKCERKRWKRESTFLLTDSQPKTSFPT